MTENIEMEEIQASSNHENVEQNDKNKLREIFDSVCLKS